MHLHLSDEKKKLLIIGLSSGVFLVLDLIFILTPLHHKDIDLRSQIISIKTNIADVEKQITTLEDLKKRAESMTEGRLDYEKRFPKEEEIPALLENLSAVAGSAGVSIRAIKPVKVEQEEKALKNPAIFREISIEILAKGGYHQLGQFINKLETLNRFMQITDIDISQDKQTPRRHNLRLLVLTYILKT